MAKKKRGRGKKKRPQPRKPLDLKRELRKALIGISTLLLLVVLAGFLTYYLVLRQPPLRPPEYIEPDDPTEQESPAAEPVRVAPPDKSPVQVPAAPPPFEIYPEEQETPPPTVPEEHLETLPRVAIIIDDMGYDRKLGEKFLDLDAVLTFSVLPQSPFRKRIAEAAKAKGHEIMLHLPMEPVEYPDVDPGPGTLLTTMSPDQLIDQLRRNIDAVPFVAGVNNHMGSRMTASSTQMRQIMSILKQSGLYFIDSRTTTESVSEPCARLLQVPFAQRDVFIDHGQEPGFIRRQMKLLVRIARERGQAVGIAHPYETTYEVFREMLPAVKEKVLLVAASDIVEAVGR